MRVSASNNDCKQKPRTVGRWTHFGKELLTIYTVEIPIKFFNISENIEATGDRSGICTETDNCGSTEEVWIVPLNYTLWGTNGSLFRATSDQLSVPLTHTADCNTATSRLHYTAKIENIKIVFEFCCRFGGFRRWCDVFTP